MCQSHRDNWIPLGYAFCVDVTPSKIKTSKGNPEAIYIMTKGIYAEHIPIDIADGLTRYIELYRMFTIKN